MADLVRIALLGTAKAGSPQLSKELPETLVVGEGGERELSPESRLLLAAGLRDLWTRAGFAAEAAGQPDQAPEDRRAPCPSQAGRLIGRMLAGEFRRILPEALDLLSEAEMRLPRRLLPAALGESSPSLREKLRPLLDRRGEWLAAQNPDWAWAADPRELQEEPARKIWEEGRFEQRLELLERLRKERPGLARRWLGEDWAQEAADSRRRLLETFTLGLSSADEPFLERALKDRSLYVRAEASRLLARLPKSALSLRLRQRAQGILRLEEESGRDILRGRPPKELPKQWAADGIRQRAPKNVGARAFWVRQLLSRIPPSHWSRRFRRRPGKLLDALDSEGFGFAIAEGWTDAALDFGGQAWMPALWRYWLGRWRAAERAEEEQDAWQRLEELLASLAPRQAEAALRPCLNQSLREDDGRWAEMVALLEPWSESFGFAYLKAVRRLSSRPGRECSPAWRRTLGEASRLLPGSCFPQALLPWNLPEAEIWEVRRWKEGVDRFETVIRFRQALHAEIGSGLKAKARRGQPRG